MSIDWSHGTAFALGVVFFVFLAFLRKPQKAEIHTRRDFMASSALRARIAAGLGRADAVNEAVHDADALIRVLKATEPGAPDA